MTAQKILLADDSVTIRKVVELTFADEGIDVISVGDGDSAMEKFHQVRPDLVIADVNMPGKNGYEVCEAIKSSESTRNIPVILLVGSFEQFDPGEASRVGANYYFTKPFHSIRELVDKVTAYLELGVTSEASTSETADIEDLYSESFQDTLEMPDNELLDTAELPADTAELESGERPVPTSAGHEHVVPPPMNWERQSSASDAEADDESASRVLSLSQADPAEPDRSNAGLADHSYVQTELGDAGMDDDIIETTHPGAVVLHPPELSATGPFDRRVDVEDVPKVSSGVETLMTGPDANAVIASDRRDIADQPEASLRFTLDDEVQRSASVVEDVRFAPRDEERPLASILTEADLAPELFEKIVNTVLARMSDKAVREAAQASVPIIAEKLIREALEEDRK